VKHEDTSLYPVTSNTYIEWVAKDKLGLSDNEYKNYSFLINTLSQIEFIWVHPMDKNRADDGIELRGRFSYETGYFLDSSSGITNKCSFFEMIAGLAIKIEVQIMRNSSGDRTSMWFFEMIKNLGFYEYTNKNWKAEYENNIRDICQKVIKREYNNDGKGGLFPLKTKKNWMNEEIWIQCMTYLKENFIKNDENLVLYS